MLMYQLECSATQDFEDAWVDLQSERSVHFRQYCNAYELLLKARLHTRPYIYNANSDPCRTLSTIISLYINPFTLRNIS